MRKSPYPTSSLKLCGGVLLLLLIIASGCKKSDSYSPPDSSSSLTSKITSYLETQKIASVDGKSGFINKNANIDLLKGNLDVASASTEQLDSKTNLLIVPIKDEIINKKGLDRNGTLALVLFTN